MSRLRGESGRDFHVSPLSLSFCPLSFSSLSAWAGFLSWGTAMLMIPAQLPYDCDTSINDLPPNLSTTKAAGEAVRCQISSCQDALGSGACNQHLGGNNLQE